MPDQVYDMLSHPPKRFGSVERTCCVASRCKLAPIGKAIRTHEANPSNPRLARTRTSHQNFVEYQDFLNRMYVQSTDKQHSSEVIPLSSYGDGTPVYHAPDREIPVYYAPDRKMFVVAKAQTINAAGAKDSGKSVWNVVDYNMMKKQK